MATSSLAYSESREFSLAFEAMENALKQATSSDELEIELGHASAMIDRAVRASGYKAGTALCKHMIRDYESKAEFYKNIDDPEQE